MDFRLQLVLSGNLFVSQAYGEHHLVYQTGK
jgi:hypothetical protein